MADRTMQSGDTWPPLKGLAADVDGPVDLPLAESMRALLKSTNTLIVLPAAPIDPPEVDGSDTYNWEAPFEDGDTDVPGTYVIQLEVTWEPGQIEKYPNSRAAAPDLVIEQGNAP